IFQFLAWRRGHAKSFERFNYSRGAWVTHRPRNPPRQGRALWRPGLLLAGLNGAPGCGRRAVAHPNPGQALTPGLAIFRPLRASRTDQIERATARKVSPRLYFHDT